MKKSFLFIFTKVLNNKKNKKMADIKILAAIIGGVPILLGILAGVGTYYVWDIQTAIESFYVGVTVFLVALVAMIAAMWSLQNLGK